MSADRGTLAGAEVAVVIPGDPVAQGRGKVARWKAKDGREGVAVRDPARSRNWKAYAADLIRQAWGDRPAWAGPLAVDVVAVWPCPKSLERKRVPRWWTWRPSRKRDDVDNVLKAALDAAAGTAYIDDGQVCDARARKVRAAQGEPGRVIVTFRSLDEDEDLSAWFDGPAVEPGREPRRVMGRGIDALLPFEDETEAEGRTP